MNSYWELRMPMIGRISFKPGLRKWRYLIRSVARQNDL